MQLCVRYTLILHYMPRACESFAVVKLLHFGASASGKEGKCFSWWACHGTSRAGGLFVRRQEAWLSAWEGSVGVDEGMIEG